MLEQKKRNNDLIYYALFFLNFISCIAFGLIYFNEALQKQIFGNPSPNTKLEIGARLTVGILQAISFIFHRISTSGDNLSLPPNSRLSETLKNKKLAELCEEIARV